MKKALVSTVELFLSGFRIAQIEDEANIFEVCPELFWADCADDVTADSFYYDPITLSILPNPPPKEITSTGTQPF